MNECKGIDGLLLLIFIIYPQHFVFILKIRNSSVSFLSETQTIRLYGVYKKEDWEI